MPAKSVTQVWPRHLVEAVRSELRGNARRDLLGWAYRTAEARVLSGKVSDQDKKRARLVLAVYSGEL